MRDRKNSLKKNIGFQAVYEILILILPLITSPYIARVIGAEGLGIYSYTYSVAYYFVIFANLGVQNYGNRTIAKCRDDEVERCKTFSEIFLIHTGTTLVCMLVYWLYFAYASESNVYTLIQGLYLLGTFFDISWFYFGIEKFDYIVFINSLIKIVTVVLIFMLVKDKDDLQIYCIILAIGTVVGQIFLWVPIKKYVHFVKVTFSGVVQHIKPLIILFIPAIAVSLYKYMDKIMLGKLATKMELGFYDNSEKVINIPSTVISAVGTVMLPRMSNLLSSHKEGESKKYIDISMRYVMLLAMGLSFGLSSISNNFSVIFWGEEFAECKILIKCLSMSIPFFAFANIIRTQYLIPREKDKEYLTSIIAGALVNLVVNFVLIPKMSAVGAAIGTVMAEGTVCIVQVYYTATMLSIKKYVFETIPFFVCGSIMAFIVNGVGNLWGCSILSLSMQILLGAFLYITMTIVVLIKYQDFYFKNLLSKLKRENRRV